jgi:hypothetical protein
MKQFAIGDGNKRISTPDCYRADNESDEITVFWDPAHPDLPIRVSVITITPNDQTEKDMAFWQVIQKAKDNDCKPRAEGNKAIYIYQEAGEGDDVLTFYEVGMANHFCIFSITADARFLGTDLFAEAQTSVESMIHTLVERAADEQFTCHFLECEAEKVASAVRKLLPEGICDSSWESLQINFDRAMADRDESLAAEIGLAFGEMMRGEIPSLSWVTKIDDYGRAMALDLGDSGISIFPEDMILKRFDRSEYIRLTEFASDTVETMEELFRKAREGK